MKRYVAKARYPLIVLLAALSVALFVQIRAMQQARARAFYPDPEPDDVAMALTRVGLDADPLAAAGLSAAATQSLVARAAEHLAVQLPVLEIIDDAWRTARATCDRLRRVVQSGTATELQLAEYASARTQLAASTVEREALLAGLFDAATADLDETQRSTLAAIRVNGDWVLPIEFLVAERSESDWVELRECLANERIALAEGEAPDPSAQATLDGARSAPAVAIAKVNYDANIVAVTEAWDGAIDSL